ncbi:osmotically inducible protein OsmC [Cyclobacterium xiamenense]|jgi:osmotically inducible protein OsmC|uniref:Osmotically inducible protein OsmC n=1 Tax=Cyclobacterium xiamenense TaxID=1297121 RepID=A0A1H6ZCP6_9BACT|nr:OsmC family protein [Cyclobacterium xiamenense]SEJ51118.1 osmotically inducible protein OsmC [Cyclobacterium xiamenense]
MKRKATAVWKGTGLEGSGTLTAPSGFFDNSPYSFKTRFENEDGTQGTNPEEMIAAAHAGCFNMALSFQIAGKDFAAEELDTTATVSLEKVGEGFSITGIVLDLKGKVPGMDEALFTELAEVAKENCPISKALSAVPIELKISFSS